MSKPTGGKVGRPPKQIPAEISSMLRAPRPADQIAAVLWDIEGEAAKAEPNPTKAGLLKGQLDALMRDRDRADGIAQDQQRIDLEAALVSIEELTAKYDAECTESEASIKELDRECDELHEKATRLEGEIASTIAVAAAERTAYLNQCPACAAATVTIEGLQQENERLRKVIEEQRVLAEKCAEGQCPSSVTRQAEIDRTSGPAWEMEQLENTVKGIEDERKRVIAAREHRAEVLAKAAKIKERHKLTDAEILQMLSGGSLEGPWKLKQIRMCEIEDDRFLAENAAIISEDAAARVKAEEKALHQKMVDARVTLGSAKMKAYMGAERYKKEFGEDRDDDPAGIMAGLRKD